MQRRFTIEVQVDLQDPTQSEAVRSAVQTAAGNLYASLVLGSFNPQIALYSDDFFMRDSQIASLAGTVGQRNVQKESRSTKVSFTDSGFPVMNVTR